MKSQDLLLIGILSFMLCSCTKSKIFRVEYSCNYTQLQQSQGNYFKNADSNYLLSIDIIHEGDNTFVENHLGDLNSLRLELKESRFSYSSSPYNNISGEFYYIYDSLYISKYNKTSGVSYHSYDYQCKIRK